MKTLRGKTAVVTGAGNGIGRACSVALAAEGMKVVIADIGLESATSVADAIRNSGGAAISIQCDVSDRDSVRSLVEQTRAAFGPADLVFANAGVTSFKPISEVSETEWDWINAVNIDGVTQCVRLFAPDMMERRCGHIIATSSMAGLIPSLIPKHAPYSASKAAIIGLMVNLRSEMAEYGVICSVLCPGRVATNILNAKEYRPARFGGAEKTTIPTPSYSGRSALWRSPEEAAPFIVDGIKKDQLFIFTDTSMKTNFESYIEDVRRDFANTEAFQAALDA